MRLVIESDQLPISYSGRDASVFSCFVSVPDVAPGRNFYLHTLSGAGRIPALPLMGLDLTVIDQSQADGVPREVKLPSVVAKRLMQFFMLQCPPREDYSTYSCIDFVNELAFGRGAVPSAAFDFISHTPATASDIKAGEFIHIRGEPMGDSLHFAYSLGDDRYLSLLGVGGSLAIATLDDMMKVYNGRHVAKILPDRGARVAFFNRPKSLIDLPRNTMDRVVEFLDADSRSALQAVREGTRPVEEKVMPPESLAAEASADPSGCCRLS